MVDFTNKNAVNPRLKPVNSVKRSSPALTITTEDARARLAQSLSENMKQSLEPKNMVGKMQPVKTVQDVLDVLKKYMGGGGAGGAGAGGSFGLSGGGGGGGSAALLEVKDEGSVLSQSVTSINFVGEGVTATSPVAGQVTVTIPGSEGGGGVSTTYSDEGVLVITDPTDINFTGDLVIVSDDGDGTARVRVLGPESYNSPSPGDPGVLIKSSTTKFEFGPNIIKQTFGPDGRLYLDVAAPNNFTVEDEGSPIRTNPSSINFTGDGVTATDDGLGGVEINIPGGAGGGGDVEFQQFQYTPPLGVQTTLTEAVAIIETGDAESHFNIALDRAGGASDPIPRFSVTSLEYDRANPGEGLGDYAIQLTPGANTTRASGLNSVAIGGGAGAASPAASGVNAIAIANQANASADNSIVLGSAASANLTATGSVVIGTGAVATGVGSVAIGENVDSLATYGTVIGSAASVAINSDNCVAIGRGANVTAGDSTVSLGQNAQTQANNAIAIGGGTTGARASNRDSIAIGDLAVVTGDYGICMGRGSGVSAQDSIAIGRNSNATLGTSTTVGYSADVLAANATLYGALALIDTGCTLSTAVGYSADVTNAATNSTALGANALVNASNQVQLGDSATTTYAYGPVQDRSDERDKADIRPVTLGLDFIMALEPIDWKWDYREDYYDEVIEVGADGKETVRRVYKEKDGSKVRSRYHHGFSAQKVKQIIEETGKDFGGFQDMSIKNPGVDKLSLGYNEFIAPLVKAVQEQQAMIDELKKEIAALKAAN